MGVRNPCPPSGPAYGCAQLLHKSVNLSSGSFLLFMFHVCLCYAVLSAPSSLMITCLERADLLALLYVMLSCVFVTFPYGVPGQVWYLVVSIPDLCILYFYFTLFFVRFSFGSVYTNSKANVTSYLLTLETTLHVAFIKHDIQNDNINKILAVLVEISRVLLR